MQHDALQVALGYLNRRERTTAEVRRHLLRRGCDEQAVEAAIAQLTEQGYLDDGRYARLFAEDKLALEQWGSGRIRRSLLERGIEGELVEEALAAGDRSGAGGPGGGACDHASELARALSLLRRRFPMPPADRLERDRALGMLLRKGYEPELALDALAAYRRDPRGDLAA